LARVRRRDLESQQKNALMAMELQAKLLERAEKQRQEEEDKKRAEEQKKQQVAVLAPAPPGLATGGAMPTLLGQWGSWGAYTASPDGKKVCFAITQATSSSTSAREHPEKPSHIFVSSRPAEKIKNEVSITIGHTFKSDSNATASIGSTSFALYTQKDGAW